MEKRLKEDALIEDALKSQPLAPMPRSITADVLARIQTAEARRPVLLTWSDFGLGLVIATCMGALWFALENLPPILVARLQIRGILLYQDFLVNSRWLVPTLFFGGAAILAALTIPFLYKMTMDDRP
ncbi:MAG: hypothetical protein ACM3XO_15495 [Bacteroidota bacterium]